MIFFGSFFQVHDVHATLRSSADKKHLADKRGTL